MVGWLRDVVGGCGLVVDERCGLTLRCEEAVALLRCARLVAVRGRVRCAEREAGFNKFRRSRG